MKIALCTTTIHVPHALKLLRKCSADAKFFVAGDMKTPHAEVWKLLEEHCDPAAYIDQVPTPYVVDRGEAVPAYKCSEALGWNTIARRNIAFLEALKWGADIIYSWDDDNLPLMCGGHFETFYFLFEYNAPFTGIKVGEPGEWFDPGTLLIPETPHRGIPHAMRGRGRYASSIAKAKIGIAAGLVIGDPDIDATTRMEIRSDIGAVHLLGQTGIVVDPHTWTVFNSQNTAVIRELIPAWFMMPNVGRHDDIYASLIVQRVARERDLHVHFGPPFCYQQRNEHNLITDLRAEIDGMENVQKLATLLDSIVIPHGWTVVDDTRRIYETLLHCEFLPRASVEAGLLWLEDVETVL